MTWKDDMVAVLQISDELADAFLEIESGSPRAAAIVSAALVDDKLTDALKAWLHQDKDLHDEFFRPAGAFGAFGTKINAAFLVGLCNAEARKELDTIRKIRNDFAHIVPVGDFDSDQMRDRIKNLVLHEKGPFTLTNLNASPPKSIVYRPPKEAPRTHRERYTRACLFFAAIFSLLTPVSPQGAMPRPPI
jgi:hypothetical protein